MTILKAIFTIGACLFAYSAFAADLTFEEKEQLGALLRNEAFGGRIPEAKKLLLQGADINSQAPFGETALANAIRRGRTKLAEFMLDHRANPNLADDDGVTPLLLAASDCNATAVKKLLRAGADVNHQDQFGRTALINAADSNCLRTVAVLVGHRGTDVTVMDYSFRKASDYTINPWITELLSLAQESERQSPRAPSVNPPIP